MLWYAIYFFSDIFAIGLIQSSILSIATVINTMRMNQFMNSIVMQCFVLLIFVLFYYAHIFYNAMLDASAPLFNS